MRRKEFCFRLRSLRKLRKLLAKCWWVFHQRIISLAVVVKKLIHFEHDRGFWWRKRWENLHFSLWVFSKQFSDPLKIFISRDSMIIFESIESVIVRCSSSVLNGIFSRSNRNYCQNARWKIFDSKVVESVEKVRIEEVKSWKNCEKIESWRKLKKNFV